MSAFPVASAQTIPSGGVKPTPEQAEALLQSRPDLVAQLRQRMMTSGMTAEQIRARLRAEGYPENILDPYLPGASGAANAPTETVFRAVQDLGIADSTDLALLGVRLRDSARAVDPTAEAVSRAMSPFRIDTMRPGPARDSVARLIINRDSGFVIFGLDLFRSNSTQFQPNLAGPVDASYRLGPGDRLVLILTGDVEASHSLDVTREGFIVIPEVGQLYVANLTLGQLEQLLFTRLSRVYSGVSRNGTGTTRFSISVARLRTNQVIVAGDVVRPGSYSVSSAGTALTALYAAMGPTINGSLRSILVRRGGQTVDTLDVYDYLLRGDASNDVRLQSGDVIFVPVHGPRARVVGGVVRPATYELKPGEGLPQLLEAAGGFSATASRRRVFVERIVPADERTGAGRERTTIDVTAPSLATGLGPTVAIQNGDVVRVFEIGSRVRNRIVVTGNVNLPGGQGITAGMKVADAIRLAGGVKSDTYLGEVLITRLRPDSTRVQLRVALADTTGAVINDIPVQEDDQIRVFSLTDFRPLRFVTIAGFVNRSGRFSYRDGMTLRDLLLLANGFKEGALLSEAEIARLPADRSKGQTAVTIRVPMDSTYLVERNGARYLGPPGLPAQASGAPEVVLQPYDNVLILRQPNFELQRSVTLNGEVRFPGTYALATKGDRLRDVLLRAGGLTDEAHADGIVFVRRGATTYRAVAAGVAGDVFAVAEQDTSVRGRATNGRIGIDLPDVLRNPRSLDNIVLEDGDEITIPRYNPVVRVQGAVNAPANVTFAPGRDIHYYINAAGGGSRTADEDRSYVTQPSGKLESIRRRRLVGDAVPVPQAGSVVTVPERDPADRRDYMALIGGVTQILASLVAIIAIARR